MKKLIIALCFFISAHCTEVKETKAEAEKIALRVPPFASHCMFIFLDDTEPELGPVGYDALAAVYQKAAPILISSHLLANIVLGTIEQITAAYQHKKSSVPKYAQYYYEAQQYWDAVHSTLNALKNSNPSPAEQLKIVDELNQQVHNKFHILFEGNQALIKSAVHFNAADWIIKEVPDTQGALLLLVPRNYKPSYKAPKSNGTFSAQALELGLKIDSLQTISIDSLFDFLKKQKIERTTSDYFMPAIWQAGKSAIFISHKDYQAAGVALPDRPQWAFLMIGHGKLQEKITAIKPDDFRQWLDFLDEHIVTKLIYYWSCYSAGTNTALVMTDEKKGVQKTYSYAIMAGAAPDTVLYPAYQPSIALESLTIRDIDFARKTFMIKVHSDYAQFVLKMTSADTIDYMQLFDALYPHIDIPKLEMSPEAFQLRMLTQVKLPGIPWFKLIDSKNITVSLGQKLAITRDTPLNIATYFGSKNKPANPRIILLYGYHFPFEIIMPDAHVPALASMTPGFTIHQFGKISLPTRETFANFVQKFERPVWKELRKIYWIKEINVATDVRVKNAEIERLRNDMDDLNAEKGTVVMGMLYGTIKSDEALQKIKKLEDEARTLEKLIDEKSIGQETLELSDLIIDLKESKSRPEIYYTRKGKPYAVSIERDRINGKEVGFMQEKEIADYHKEYQHLIDTNEPFQQELQRAQEIGSISRALEKRSTVQTEKKIQQSQR